MKLRFPLSHRARYQRPKEDDEGENQNRKGRRPVGRHHRPEPETDPAVLSCRDPAVL